MTIEETIRNFLLKKIDKRVCLEKPAKPPESYILIENTGGGEENFLRNCTLAIQSYAQSMQAAAELSEEVISAMKEAVVLDVICKVKLNSNYNFTDTETKQYRYQTVFNLVYY